MLKRLSLLPFWVLLILLGGCAGNVSPPRKVLAPTSITFADLDSQELRFETPAELPVLVTISGHGIDVRAAVLPGRGQAPVFADAPNRRMGIETLLVEAPHGPSLVIRIERNDNSGARGTVRVEAVALPVATDADRKRLAATRQEATGCLAFLDPGRGEESARAFEAAAKAHEAIGDRHAAGRALLQAAGARYVRLADWNGAAELAARAGKLLDDEDAAGLAAFALRVEGAALDQYGNASNFAGSRDEVLQLARLRLAGAAAQFLELGNPYEAGYALNYRGVSYYQSGDRIRARTDFQAALERFSTAGDQPAQALSLQSLASISHDEGRLGDAAREFDRALALIPADVEPTNYAHTLSNSALPLRVLGRFDEAISRFFRAGEILRRLGDRDGEARALHGLATTLMYAGEPERAAELLRYAVRLRGQTGARREQAMSLLVLGNIERDAGRPGEAARLHGRSLELLTAPHDRARVLLALARDEHAAGRPARAERLLNELLQLPLPASQRTLGLALTELGTLDAQRGHNQNADDHFARAIRIHEANGSDIDHAWTLHRRAEASLRRLDTAGALADSAAALRLFDAVGMQSLHGEGRAAFRSSYRDVVELRIQALLRSAESAQLRGDPAAARRDLLAALGTSDRARAQWLSEPSAPERGHLPDELLTERQNLYELLAGKRELRERLLESPAPDAERIAQFTRDIELLRARAVVIDGRIAGASPGVRAAGHQGTYDAPPALPADTTVAEFFVGRTHSWLFVVRDGQVAVHKLAAPAEIDRMARELHESWRKAAPAAQDRLASGRTLARLLYLPMGSVPPADDLRIVADGALHLLPMALLARQVWPQLPPGSATVVPALRALRDNSEASTSWPDRTLAVIADPVYTTDDSRIRSPGPAAEATKVAALTRGARDMQSVRRLPATSVEARELLALIDRPEQKLALVGPQASREQVFGAPLARYRIIHFATHAFADSEDPELATLALSRWDAGGRPVDGALRLYDIARLRLNADLVVLSGCDTALGREIAGEGPIGLSHAFLRSGARSVVATLWQVPDTSTAALMREFYRQMLVSGHDAPIALQLAQEYLRRQSRWSDPYYWAGFQLVSIAWPANQHQNVTRRRES